MGPTFLAEGTSFVEEFSMNQWSGDGLRMIQAHYNYCSLYFCYDYINSTSDRQALDPRGWGYLVQWVEPRITYLPHV